MVSLSGSVELDVCLESTLFILWLLRSVERYLSLEL